jgi:cytochrome c oxidase assembly factor 2
MPHYLHPRSRSTSSLFAATLLASFVIVGVPHIFPCPAPRRTLADSDMTMAADGQQIQRPRRKKRKTLEPTDQLTSADSIPRGQATTDEEVSTFLQLEKEAETMAKVGRECPVPKPGGIVGQILGFTDRGKEPREGRDGAPRTDIPGRGDGS